MKQSCIVDFILEDKCVIAFEATKEVIWFQKFLMGLRIVPLVVLPLVLFCNNSGVVA